MKPKSVFGLALLAMSAWSHAQPHVPVERGAFQALSRPMPDVVVPYGTAPSQAIDVFLPQGIGPHPVAILIHGGCWSVRTAGREQLRHMGAALASRGIATWSIGYRRADEEGGGYPGTFMDVARAFDQLIPDSARFRLDLNRTVAVGHSAGGHLALWAASRGSLAQASMLRGMDPFVPQSTISLAGVGDLRAYSRFVPLHCGPGVLDRLVPPMDAERLYREISPASMPSLFGRVTLYSGVLDRLVPPYVANEFAAEVKRRQDKPVVLVDVPDAGHFDFVTPGTPAWDQVMHRIEDDLSEPVGAPRMGREF